MDMPSNEIRNAMGAWNAPCEIIFVARIKIVRQEQE